MDPLSATRALASDVRVAPPPRPAPARGWLDGPGTRPAAWRVDVGALAALPRRSAREIVAPGRRMVVVAPHPDDELLALGGLMSAVGRQGNDITIVAVTDGEASHPGSIDWTPGRLRSERAQERARALAAMDVAAPHVMRLRLPDGEVAAHQARLEGLLEALLCEDDVVFSTWRGDGHPDHEATGRAAAAACGPRGLVHHEVPVWMWHWAKPGDARVDWRRAFAFALSRDALLRKRRALAMHASQLAHDASTGRPPVISASLRAGVARPFELVFA